MLNLAHSTSTLQKWRCHHQQNCCNISSQFNGQYLRLGPNSRHYQKTQSPFTRGLRRYCRREATRKKQWRLHRLIHNKLLRISHNQLRRKWWRIGSKWWNSPGESKTSTVLGAELLPLWPTIDEIANIERTLLFASRDEARCLMILIWDKVFVSNISL